MIASFRHLERWEILAKRSADLQSLPKELVFQMDSLDLCAVRLCAAVSPLPETLLGRTAEHDLPPEEGK